MEPSGTVCVPLACDRAMAHYNCEVKSVLGQALISLKSTEERDNIVAICIITEVSLSPATPGNVPFRSLIEMYTSVSCFRCACCWGGLTLYHGVGSTDSLAVVVNKWADGANPCPISQQPRCLPERVSEGQGPLPEPRPFQPQPNSASSEPEGARQHPDASLQGEGQKFERDVLCHSRRL